MKLKTKKRIQGSISILLAIILVPTMLLSGLMVDLSRFSMAKAMVSSAGDLTMNAALADYDAILKEVYGLFAISQDDDELYKNLNEYFKTTLVSGGVVSEEDSQEYLDAMLGNLQQYLYVDKNSEVNMKDISNLFDMQISADAAVKGAEGSTLANPDILKKQIVEYMKYRAPINIGLSFFSSLNSISKSGQQANVVQSKISAEEKTTQVQSAAQKLYNDLVEYDKRLYTTKKIIVGSEDIDKPLDGEEALNDTEGLASYVNGEIYHLQNRYEAPRQGEDGNYWDYETVNRYVLGFLLDDKREEVNFNAQKPHNADSGLKDKKDSWKKGADVNKDDIKTALNDAADKLDEKAEALSSYHALHDVFAEPAAIQADDNQVRSSYDTAVRNYKTLFALLGEENTAQAKAMNQAYSDYLDAAAEMEATYADAAKYLKMVIEAKDDEEDEEKASELENKKTDIEQIFTVFLNDHQKDGEQNPYNGLSAPNDKGELEDESGTLDKAEQEVAVLETESLYNSCYDNYTNYINFSKTYAEQIVNDIYDEADYIYNKTMDLEKLLNQIIEDTNTLLEQVDSYNSALKSWEDSNNTYQNSANGGNSDEFSSNNSEELEANRQRYDKESIEKVRTYAQEQLAKIYPFKGYLNGHGWKYGSLKLNKISSVDNAVDAAGAMAAEFKNKASVTEAECNAMLKTLCPESQNKYDYSETSTALYSFLKQRHIAPSTGEEETLLQFVGYLKCTFTQTAQYEKSKTVTDESGNTEDAKGLYDSLKKSVSDGDSVTNEEEETEQKDKYGYTYQGKTTPGSDSSSPSNTANANAEDASGSYKQQKDGSSSLLANIGNALGKGFEASRNNIFVMEYIMDNFSYNTMVQDAACDGYKKEHKDSENVNTEFYTTAKSDQSIYSNYKALTAEEKAALGEDGKDEHDATRPKTLSGYPISSYNNEYYGAEVEYLFYGMNSAENNVTAAYSSIYGIRFILNSVYAFSNTEIRNMARTAGLSVQAATVGVVPYQAVMVVIQLALAMSESMLDLDIMKTGAKVAVVPTKDTWMLSPTGASKLLKTAVKAKAQEVADTAITDAINNASDGLQKFVDSSAEDIDQNASELLDNLDKIAGAKADEVMDQAFGEVENTLMAELNKLPQIDYSGGEAAAAVNAVFDAAAQKQSEIVASLNGENGSEVAKAISNLVDAQMAGLLEEMRTEALSKLSEYMATAQNNDPGNVITSYMYEIESGISEKIQKRISETSSAAKTLAKRTTQEAASAINSVVADQSEEAKKKAIQAVNQFIDTKVNSVADQISDVSNLASSGQSFSGSSAVSHAISFGYSDYLRLMIFMGLSTGKNDILLRTADLIERNINYPNQAVKSEAKSDSFFGELFRKISWFFGNTEDGKTAAEKKWQMSKAYTYVQIDADIDMDMFFMKTTLFQNWMNAGMAEVGADAPDMTLTKSTYHYHSVMGY